MAVFAELINLLLLIYLTVVFGENLNTNHEPNDRPRHLRPHNLHRPPYEGYEWYTQLLASESKVIASTHIRKWIGIRRWLTVA